MNSLFCPVERFSKLAFSKLAFSKLAFSKLALSEIIKFFLTVIKSSLNNPICPLNEIISSLSETKSFLNDT